MRNELRDEMGDEKEIIRDEREMENNDKLKHHISLVKTINKNNKNLKISKNCKSHCIPNNNFSIHTTSCQKLKR